jgi:hypothetical protein
MEIRGIERRKGIPAMLGTKLKGKVIRSLERGGLGDASDHSDFGVDEGASLRIEGPHYNL